MRVGSHLTPALHATILVQAFFRPVPLSFCPSQFPNKILLHFWGGLDLQS